jgi:hypothetical protein
MSEKREISKKILEKEIKRHFIQTKIPACARAVHTPTDPTQNRETNKRENQQYARVDLLLSDVVVFVGVVVPRRRRYSATDAREKRSIVGKRDDDDIVVIFFFFFFFEFSVVVVVVVVETRENETNAERRQRCFDESRGWKRRRE